MNHPLCADYIFIGTGETSGENGPFSRELIKQQAYSLQKAHW